MRLASKRKKLAISSSITPQRCIDVKVMRTVELEILKCVQLRYFPEKFHSLIKSGVDVAHVKETSGLRSLGPVLADGLLRPR